MNSNNQETNTKQISITKIQYLKTTPPSGFVIYHLPFIIDLSILGNLIIVIWIFLSYCILYLGY